ncbi:MAG: polysaccharide deacetylase [Lachnospiraceae bacterium]|jgi:peptidoglycan/xylan/chitin deacetylase (PgdA/CDA1 family)|nr:polysaccharide deacetylase [Lachnospiraceae bacterium]
MSERDDRNSDERHKRVRAYRRLLITLIVISIILPLVLCTILFIRIGILENRVKELSEEAAVRKVQLEQTEKTRWNAPAETEDEQKELTADRQETVTKTTGVVKLSGAMSDRVLAAAVSGNEIPSGVGEQTDEQSAAADDGRKKVYLTFDDGPSPYTNDILDILADYGIKATFFVTGKEGTENEEAYRRIVQEGHTIGMHSYSHKYSQIYSSKRAFVADLKKLQDYITEVTGVKPMIYRFPGGSSNTVSRVPIRKLLRYLKEEQIEYYDWNVANGDAAGQDYSVRDLVNNVVDHIDSFHTSIVLMHDAPDKEKTVQALPEVIERLLIRGDVDILPITKETTKVQHVVLEE